VLLIEKGAVPGGISRRGHPMWDDREKRFENSPHDLFAIFRSISAIAALTGVGHHLDTRRFTILSACGFSLP
jgi:hypothetical protein